MNKFDLLNEIKYYAYRRARKRWLKNDFKMKKPCLLPLSAYEKKDIIEYWKSKMKHDKQYIDYRWFEVYNRIESDKSKLKYYIPDDFYYCYVDTFFSHPRNAELLDDKNMYDLFFQGVRQPQTIIRNIKGSLLDASYQLISIESAVGLCKCSDQVVCKESICSSGGKGVSFWNYEDDEEKLRKMLLTENIIIQNMIEQHNDVASIHPSSVNTIRIMTLFFKGKVHILSSVFRMGIGESKVDNANSGGIVAGINSNGRLKPYAYDARGNKYENHPQGGFFENVIIPNFEECKELVKYLAPRFLSVASLISWDLAIGKDGHPILIEANLSFGEMDFHQMNNGPLFGDMTDEIIDYICTNNKFIR